jgi:MFS family permease
MTSGRPVIGRPGLLVIATATVSRLADNAAAIALVLLIIARTHDPRLAGLVVGAFTVPTLVTGPVLGAYLDRTRRKRPLFAVNQVALAAALGAVLVLTGRVPGWLLAVFGLCAGLTAPVLTGGYSSLVPLVVPAAALGRANALDSASYDVAGLAGPGLVAAIAGAFGAGAALGCVAAVAACGLFFVLAAPMPAARMQAAPMPAAPGPDARAPAAESLLSAVADGLRLLRDSRELRSVSIAGAASQFFQGPLPVALPLLTIALGRPASGGGWLLTALSAGGLAGSLLSDRLLTRRSGPVVLFGALLGFFLLLAALAVAPFFWAALVLAALAGLVDGPSFAATLTVRQRTIPADRYAQATTTAASLKTGAYALGAACGGLLTGVLTARQLLLALAAGQLLAALPLLDRPDPRGLVGAPGS